MGRRIRRTIDCTLADTCAMGYRVDVQTSTPATLRVSSSTPTCHSRRVMLVTESRPPRDSRSDRWPQKCGKDWKRTIVDGVKK
jgi:hypothetical protein